MSLENDIIKPRFKENSSQLKSIKRLVIFATVLYCLFLPFVLLHLLSVWVLILMSIKNAPIEGSISLFMTACIPLSLLISIGKMWSHYLKQNISKVYWYCALPFLTVLFVVVVGMIQMAIWRITR